MTLEEPSFVAVDEVSGSGFLTMEKAMKLERTAKRNIGTDKYRSSTRTLTHRDAGRTYRQANSASMLGVRWQRSCYNSCLEPDPELIAISIVLVCLGGFTPTDIPLSGRLRCVVCILKLHSTRAATKTGSVRRRSLFGEIGKSNVVSTSRHANSCQRCVSSAQGWNCSPKSRALQADDHLLVMLAHIPA